MTVQTIVSANLALRLLNTCSSMSRADCLSARNFDGANDFGTGKIPDGRLKSPRTHCL